MKTLLKFLMALSIVATSFSSSYALSIGGPDGSNGNYFFRFSPVSETNVNNPGTPEISKDITAFFVGVVGQQFSQLLPMKPEWQADNWQVDQGYALPAGITFDPSSLTFSGNPTTGVKGLAVNMTGYDSAGNKIATAAISFDVYALQGIPVHINVYAHTGVYKKTLLQVPAGLTVDKWDAPVYSLPAGITAQAELLQGTPTAATPVPAQIYIIGRDYNGKAITTFWGSYQVDDGPTFAYIKDDLHKLPDTGGVDFDFYPPRIQHPAGDASKVRYYLEIQDGERMPGNVSSNAKPFALETKGNVWRVFDQTTVRYRAVDIDNTTGWSRWFTFGTTDPTPSCQASGFTIDFYTGKTANTQLPVPDGSRGTLSYALTGGKLPPDITLTTSGKLVGTPKAPFKLTGISVTTSMTNDGNVTVAPPCSFSVEVKNGALALTDATAAQNRHIRVGSEYDGVLKVAGGIPDYTVDFNATDHAGLTFRSATKNTALVTASGTIDTAGLPISVPFKVTNGDANTDFVNLSIYAHPALAVDQMPDFTVKRLAASQTWSSIPYVADSVIPDASGKIDYPTITIDHPERLPQGISFDGRGFVGTTSDPEGTYGPFVATVTDFSGDSVPTNSFSLNVIHRDELKIAQVNPPTFAILVDTPQVLQPVTITQPPGAAKFAVQWAISPTPPAILSFDSTSGKLTAQANLTFEDKSVYGPYTVTATDSEGSHDTSAGFSVTVKDIDQPGQIGSFATSNGTVSGNAAAGETATTMSVTGLISGVDRARIIGGIENVVFTTSTPLSPAGLTWNPSDGSFSGVPTAEYTGSAVVGFKDAKGRTGQLTVPFDVKPYPTIRDLANYDVARLASPANTAPTPNQGFWNPPKYTLLSGSLPSDITVNSATGELVGQTTDAIGTVAGPVVIQATSAGVDSGVTLVSRTDPFTVTVVASTKMQLKYAPATQTYYLNDKVAPATDYTMNSLGPVVKPTVTGTNVPPLVYTTDGAGPQGMTIDAGTGAIIWPGPYALGTWTTVVTATDSETTPASFPLTVKATLAGYVMPPVTQPGGGSDPANPNSYALRVNEPFKSNPIVVTNAVGDTIFTTNPDPLPSSLDYSAATGAFSDDSTFTTAGSRSISINAKDADARTFQTPIKYTFAVVDKVKLPDLAKTSFSSTQYDPASALNVQFTAPANIMGEASFSIGGSVPGTLVNKNYTKDGVFVSYTWWDGTVDPANPVFKTVPSTQQPSPESYLPLDALVFDPVALTLKGIPSKAGTFAMTYNVADDHAKGYIQSVPTQASDNSASKAFTVTVAPALALKATNSAASETVAQYTGQPQITTTVANTAYGVGIYTWEGVTGTLPNKVRTAPYGAVMAYGGYPDTQGTSSNIVWKGTDAAGQTVVTDPISMTVGPRGALTLVSTANPKGMVVNVTDADMTVSATNSPNGAVIPAAKWSVSGAANLPPKVTYAISDGGVHFAGVSTTIGTYTGITVSATDALGVTATLPLTFKVIVPTDAIALTVADITAKANYAFSYQATATNTYGKVRFYSNDIPTALSSQLSVSMSGLISGKIATVGTVPINVAVTDDSTRLTSHPVNVNIIPNLRVTVPTQVVVTQGVQATQAVTTAYNIGTVTYSQGAGNWPSNVSVNATTGLITIAKTTSAVGTYGPLYVNGVDTYGDAQPSNAFSIVVNRTPSLPVIANVSNNKLAVMTVGTAIPGFTPTVTDSVLKTAWAYGKSFKLNHDVVADTGLSFDTATGAISGTPTKAVLYTDLIMTVTADTGDISSTAPFYFGVQPAGAITATAGQKTSYELRIGDAFKADAPSFDNVYSGPLATKVYSSATKPAGTTVSTTTGVISGTLTTAATTSTTVTIADVFARKATLTYSVKVDPKLTVAVPDVSVALDTQVNDVAVPVITGGLGTLNYSADGLPPGFSMNASTGKISGTLTTQDAGDTASWPVTVTLTDSFDGKTATDTYNVFPARNKHLYWAWFDTTVWNGNGSGQVTELKIRDPDGNDLAPLLVSPAPTSATFDGNTTTTSFGVTAGQKYIMKFSKPVWMSSMQMYQNVAAHVYVSGWSYRWSDDGVTFHSVASTSSQASGVTLTAVQPQ